METHLFKPPFITLDITYRKGNQLLIEPIKYILHFRNLQQLGSILGTAMSEHVRLLKTPECLVEKMKSEFSMLQASQWQPKSYLNPQDYICNDYIDYFEDLDKSLAKYIGPNSFHLIPKATVIINQETFCLCMLACLANKQWFEDMTENLTQKSYNLIHPCFQYQCNGLDGDGRALNSDLCTAPSPKIDPDEDLICWASCRHAQNVHRALLPRAIIYHKVHIML